MKRMLALVTVLVLVAVGCSGLNPVEGEAAVWSHEDLRSCWDLWSGDALKLQWGLTRWYAVCLESDGANLESARAYPNILAGVDGIMGEIAFNDGNFVLPIYHDGSRCAGFVHRENSPFPTGEQGGAVLRLSGWDLPEHLISENSVFEIRILDSVTTYQVTEISAGTLPEGAGDCILVIPGGDGERIMLAKLMQREIED